MRGLIIKEASRVAYEREYLTKLFSDSSGVDE